jgi:glycosyltransferase involved in cell wall biosynthesis
MGEAKRRKATGRGGRRLTVAVCIPTVPGREELRMRAELSVMKQDRQPDQFLVEVDKDRTGAAATRNRLLERVESDVIAWLDDDDWLKPNHLKACMRVIENTFAVDLVYPRPHLVNGRDPTAVTHQGRFPVSPWGLRFTQEMAAHIKHVGSFIPITHLVRTESVRRIGGFPESRVLPDGRLQGEDERYLIELLDSGAQFEHLDQKTWYWYANPHSTKGLGSP